jgi:hypothetical protein
MDITKTELPGHETAKLQANLTANPGANMPGNARASSSLVARLRKDLRFGTFYMLPLLAGFRDELTWMADVCKLPLEQVAQNRRELLDAGYWLLLADGTIKTSQPYLPLGDKKDGALASSNEFMTMASQLLSRISDEGPCWFEWHSVATTNALKMEFLSRVNQALTEFIVRSKEAKGETVVAWAHVSLDSLKALRAEDDSWRV